MNCEAAGFYVRMIWVKDTSIAFHEAETSIMYQLIDSRSDPFT